MTSLRDYLPEEVYEKIVKNLKKNAPGFERIGYIISPDKIYKRKVPDEVKFGDIVNMEGIIMGVGKGRAEESITEFKKNQYGYGDAVNRILSYLTMQKKLEQADKGLMIDNSNNVLLFIGFVPNSPRFKVSDTGKVSFNASVEETISESGWVTVHIDPRELRLEELNVDMVAGKYVTILGRIWETEGNDGRKFRHAMAYGLLITE